MPNPTNVEVTLQAPNQIVIEETDTTVYVTDEETSVTVSLPGIQGPPGQQIVSDTPPPAPNVSGDQWYNSSNGREYVYYDGFWVEIGAAFQGPVGNTGATGATGIQISASAPALTTVLWADTTAASSGFIGLPAGGTTGQSLVKIANTDYQVGWTTPVATSEPFITLGNSANLSNERALTAGNGIVITDNGPGSTVAISTTQTTLEFTTPGTGFLVTVPTGARLMFVTLLGGGGGGGGGARQAAGVASTGGGGGAPGLLVEGWLAVEDGATYTVDVGAGGGGGLSATTDSSNGSAGGTGGNTILRRNGATAFWAYPGGGAAGGSTAVATGGVGNAWGSSSTSSGQASSLSDLAGTAPLAGPVAGAAGGSITSANVATQAGSSNSCFISNSIAGIRTGVTGSGSSATAATVPTCGVAGSGGGGGQSNLTGAAGHGSAGARGGGGGGGGASRNGFAAGLGGSGGDGYLRIVFF